MIPIYDIHDSIVSTFAGNGTSYTCSTIKGLEAWGVVRVGGQPGDPKGRYCESLGHKHDDESGPTYMRARYY